MRRAVFLTYLFFAAFSLVGIFWLIPRYTPEYSGYGMPPGALPYTLCGVMFLFSLPILVRTLRGKDGGTPNPLPWKKWLHLGAFSAVMFATMPLMQRAGFLPGAMVILAMLQLLCGQRNASRLVVISAAVSTALWACMRYVLNVPMP